jgi:hypothetical protein
MHDDANRDDKCDLEVSHSLFLISSICWLNRTLTVSGTAVHGNQFRLACDNSTIELGFHQNLKCHLYAAAAATAIAGILHLIFASNVVSSNVPITPLFHTEFLG